MFRETQVAGYWDKISRKDTVLQTVDDQPVRILYPGRPSDEPGADYLDAVIDIANETRKGNIEVHVRTKDWQAHRHHVDTAYNGVILHVVGHHDGTPTTPCQDGTGIPVVSMETMKETLPKNTRPKKCRVKHAAIGSVLDIAGDIRFREKTNRFQKQLATGEPGQIIYEGLMAALGYSRNTEAFRTVAGNVPLHQLEESLSDAEPSAAEAKLLTAGGFLSPAPLHPPRWKLFRIRPANYPPRRLAAMAYLLRQCLPTGLLEYLQTRLKGSSPDSARNLENALMVQTYGYWQTHFDIGRADKSLGSWLIGQTTARIMVINAVLPFFAALEENAEMLYRAFPPSEENAVERHMKRQLGLTTKEINTSRRQQGLLHLYKNYCTAGQCEACPLTRPAA
jgi:hypothetical protein